MTTPNREQIIERATELYFNANPQVTNNPEVSELIESGFFWSAQAELMSNTTKTIREQSKTFDLSIYDFSFDCDLMQKSNLLISGSNHSGKTRLASMIASILRTFNWQIVVLDNSGAWIESSDLDFYQSLQQGFSVCEFDKQSIILDTSDLTLEQQKKIAETLSLQLWNRKQSEWVCLFIEEAELFCKNLRGSTSQNLFRLFSVGRNRKIRVSAITTDLALLDPSFIRLCSQRFHGRLNPEQNAKTKFKSYYGQTWLDVAQKLATGSFVYLHDTDVQLINAQLFTPKTKPMNLSMQFERPQKTSFWSRLLERPQRPKRLGA